MFNPNEHMMKLKGKDYLQVAWRLVWFREDQPTWSINTAIVEHDEEHAIFKAVISDDTGAVKSTGHGSESKRDFGDFLEKAETKAVGRALAMLGYGTQFAADELDEGERIVDSPINRAPTGSQEAAQDAGMKKLEQLNQQMQKAAENAPENPVRGLATAEQKKYIQENADDETYMKAMQAFGPDLERMTKAQANKLITRIMKQAQQHNEQIAHEARMESEHGDWGDRN